MTERIAELSIDVKGSRSPMRFAIYKPRWVKRMKAWGCRFSLGRPIGVSRVVYGENSTQALILSLKVASSYLYGSQYYKKRKLGCYGEFGGDLCLPASHSFLDIAPYPF